MSGRASLPDFIVIGAMKCATSTLHVQLARQGGITMSEPKEPNFFSDDDVWSRGLDWYRGLFAAAPPGDLRGESSTHYTKLPTHPDTVPRLALHVPDVKLVYVMRHPVDRLVSHYAHEWSQGVTDDPMDVALERVPGLVDYGRYAMQLEPYRETFGPEAILPVFFERLVSRPQEQLERIAAFIGSPDAVRWHDEEQPRNQSRARERPTRLRDGLRRVPGLRPLVRALVPETLRERVRSRLWRLGERPEPDAALRRRLEAAFDPDLARLGSWLGVELSCANYAAVVDRPSWSWRQRTMVHT